MNNLLQRQDLPRRTKVANYQIDVPLSQLQDHIKKQKEEVTLNLDPDYQRGRVWPHKTKVAWIEFLLQGGIANPIYFNCPGWMKDFRGPFEIVEGKQRLETTLEFLENKFPVFPGLQGKNEGWFRNEIEPKIFQGIHLKIAIHNLQTRKEVLKWYLELNEGQVPHTDEEFARVRKLLQKAD